MIREDAWQVLIAAARDYSESPDANFAKALSLSAIAWAKANDAAVKGTNGKTLRSGAVVPFGRSRGLPIEEATKGDLEVKVAALQWVSGALRESIADPAKARWAPQNRELLAAIEAELETR